ncbi:MAG: pyridoxal phosphate-dependent aminotransferase [Lachnospiraceae bacterium]|jgi:cystathionine beta-lyase|nr:pyridoxal phosphate-dependent aminotransferase [Lachnospiraceae bacterium]MCI9357853.1 pyridoxal phosphate-dependent aminotransferase [Lachnospiraceae bacterium]
MKFDFDKVIQRKGTNSLKYDFAEEYGKPADALPLWVADMDFQTAPPILKRLEQLVQHGIFGYTDHKEDYVQAVKNWYQHRFAWDIQGEWIVKMPGVVAALAMAVRAFTKEGDSVLIQRPVYHPFSSVVETNRRNLVNNPLKLVNGYYEIDFDDFEKKIVDHQVKLFILCSPHNPVGRVWKEWELKRMGDICLKYKVLVASDEIHSDFVWQGFRHRVFASLSPAYQEITITCTAPSKTFNLAGLQAANVMIADPQLREKFRQESWSSGYSELNAMGLAACQAAYEEGGEWLEELKEYIWGNYLFLKEYLEAKMPQITPGVLEGTYLAWLDFRNLGLGEEKLEEMIVNRARVWFNGGTVFGPEGEGFQRVNIACPRPVLAEALKRLEQAVNHR